MNGVELRDGRNGQLVLRGYASVSERWYPVGRRFEEKMRRGAWRRMLGSGPDTVLAVDHEGLGLARTKTPSGEPSLILDETGTGLRCEAFLDATAPRVQDLRSTAENCGLQMSVGMFVQDDLWNSDGNRREVNAASTHRGDVTVTNFGANDAAAATISERSSSIGEAERRELKGSRERRMCPIFDLDGYDVRESSGSTLTVARRSVAMPVIVGVAAERTRRDRAIARAARADAGLGGNEPRYTDKEIQQLGEEGYALKKRSGRGYHYPIKDGRDLSDAVKAWPRAVPSERGTVKAWIIKRAIVLRLIHRLPEGWQPK
jgi:phage head maturation protease